MGNFYFYCVDNYDMHQWLELLLYRDIQEIDFKRNLSGFEVLIEFSTARKLIKSEKIVRDW